MAENCTAIIPGAGVTPGRNFSSAAPETGSHFETGCPLCRCSRPSDYDPIAARHRKRDDDELAKQKIAGRVRRIQRGAAVRGRARNEMRQREPVVRRGERLVPFGPEQDRRRVTLRAELDRKATQVRVRPWRLCGSSAHDNRNQSDDERGSLHRGHSRAS